MFVISMTNTQPVQMLGLCRVQDSPFREGTRNLNYMVLSEQDLNTCFNSIRLHTRPILRMFALFSSLKNSLIAIKHGLRRYIVPTF